MATVNAGDVGSGPGGGFLGVDWNTAHDASVGPTGMFWGVSNNTNATGAMMNGPRVASSTFFGQKYFITRLWMDFDLSGQSGTATAVSLKVTAIAVDHDTTNRNVQTTKIIPVKTTKSAGTVDQDTINDLDGWEAGFGPDDLTAFASEQTIDNADDMDDTLYTFNLNSDGLASVNSAVGSGNLSICMMEYDHDYLDTSSGVSVWDHYTTNLAMTGATEPYLEITYGTSTSAVIVGVKLSGGSFNINGGNLIIK